MAGVGTAGDPQVPLGTRRCRWPGSSRSSVPAAPSPPRTCLRGSALPLHLFAFPSSQPVLRVHPLVMAAPLGAVLSPAPNTPRPSPWQDSRCERHLSFPFSYFFAPISPHHVLFLNFFSVPSSSLPVAEGQILLPKAAPRNLSRGRSSGGALGNDF